MMATTLFLDVFEPSIVEKLVDHFVIYGDGSLYGIGVFIIEQIVGMYPEINGNTEIDDLISIAKLVEDVVIIQKLLYLDDLRSTYDLTVKAIKSES